MNSDFRPRLIFVAVLVGVLAIWIFLSLYLNVRDDVVQDASRRRLVLKEEEDRLYELFRCS